MRQEITLSLLRDGYQALHRLRRENGDATWFAARMLGRRALLVSGEDGVRTFCDLGLVFRAGPGEPLAVGILEVTGRELARTEYELTPESRTVPLRRVPSLPPGGAELRRIRRAATWATSR
jgi:hypothetical protein